MWSLAGGRECVKSRIRTPENYVDGAGAARLRLVSAGNLAAEDGAACARITDVMAPEECKYPRLGNDPAGGFVALRDATTTLP